VVDIAAPEAVAPEAAAADRAMAQSSRLSPLAACLPSRDPSLSMEMRIEGLFSELNADALRFQEAYYSERRYLHDLDQRRCAGYDEILTPSAA